MADGEAGRAVATGAQAEIVDAVIVGAGFAGLYILYRLRGLGLHCVVIEAGGDVGGTWYWNRYPGARCDIESLEYSYQFSEELQRDWAWSERYASQPEILRYAGHVADRFDLRRDIRFNTQVLSARFDDATGRWLVGTADGAALSAKYVVMATGCLSVTNLPAIPGIEGFSGPIYHTGKWPHQGVDFTGRRVAVIGTGSSAIQSIPHIAAQASHLTVFQRTPNYSVPARNRKLEEEERAAFTFDIPGHRAANSAMPFGFGARYGVTEQLAAASDAATLEAEYERRWQIGGLPFMGAFADLFVDPAANQTAADFVRRKIAEAVTDPAVAEMLSPSFVLGCKRLCVDTGYYETFNRPNVTLVDLSRTPITHITSSAVHTAAGAIEVDDLVLATGFDAMTGALLAIDIRGAGGLALRDKWADGPRTYLGLGVAGFPNLFTVTGPGSPSVLSNMLPSIEQHVNWIADCIDYLQQRQMARIEPTRDAEDAWVAHVAEVIGGTLLTTCNSWYIGANVAGKKRVYMPYLGVPTYAEKCREVAAKDYEGFVLTPG
jgi:cyclohexanone monooxygenase